jgi:penicillin-binding protein 2
MFERRLKILLFLFLLAAGALALRAAQIQIIQRNTWRDQAVEIMKRAELIETTRGTIFDCKGVPLAFDAPCVDAGVDYRAILDPPDPDWIEKIATQNLKDRLGKDISHSPNWQTLREDECDKLRGAIADMWTELAIVGDKSPEQIDELRREIVNRVEMRKRLVWWRNYQKSEGHESDGNSTAWYRQFLGDNSSDESVIDKFEGEVKEETTPHMILHNIPPDIQARLAREQSRFFCLTLVPSKFRDYAFKRVACNVLGYLDTVRPDEVASEADFTDQAARSWTSDLLNRYGLSEFLELRMYLPTDLAGRAGIESLCENTLRGTRGKIERVSGTDNIVDQIDARPGKNVSLSIDIQLQQDIENEFVKTRVHRDNKGNVETRYNQHGAAVVIDVPTGKVLALVSCPGYDLNNLTTQYSVLAADELNRPLLDRATQMAVVPGSTVKPIVGSGAITDGVMTSRDKIQCRGELIIDGRPQPYGHCWIWAGKARDIPVTHGSSGGGDPNIGPDDMLTISDGIKDSCNVVFETVALRLGMAKLSNWFDQFGLGRPTGIGIEESPGMIYRPSPDMTVLAQTQTWSAGIGEGHIQATPIQMANVAATIARNGVWMRPHLVENDDVGRSTTGSSSLNGPDVVDLHLSPDALQAVQKGMREVCSESGTGKQILPEFIDRGPSDPPLEEDPLLNIPIAGKTGSAQTQQLLTLVNRDASGKVTLTKIHFGDPGTEGWYLQPPDTQNDPRPEMHLAHGWYIGYAPADHPRIAFCVFVEYGEAGGRVAGGIAHDLLVDCVKHGYLSAEK